MITSWLFPSESYDPVCTNLKKAAIGLEGMLMVSYNRVDSLVEPFLFGRPSVRTLFHRRGREWGC